MSLRVSAIDYLGVVAAHLRKDAVNSQQDTEGITEILVEVWGEKGTTEKLYVTNKRRQNVNLPIW